MNDPATTETNATTEHPEPPQAASDVPLVASPRDLPKPQPGTGIARLATSPVAWAFLAALGLALVAVLSMRRPRAPELPRLGSIPAFQLTDQQGRAVTSDSFRGKIVIADFIFLGCQQSCPKLTSRMLDLQRKATAQGGAVAGKVRFASFSVDPENDTPPRLHEYAQKFGADEGTWTFLTGSNAAMEKTIVDGFKMQIGKVDDGAGVFTIMHGDWFLLIDGQGTIRGYYDSSDLPNMQRILADAGRLAEGT